MDLFTKKRFTAFVVTLLLILNLGTLSLLWKNRMDGPPGRRQLPLHERKEDVPRFLKDELGWNEEQFEEYLKLRGKHFTRSRVVMEEIHLLKRQIMDELFRNELDSNNIDRILKMLSEKQEKMERLTFEHFRDLKMLCGNKQQEKFRQLLRHFFKSAGPKAHRPPPGPGRRRN